MRRPLLTLLLLLCLGAACGQSPYISRVYEFLPAPGQFVNVLPAANASSTAQAMAQAAQDRIAGDKRSLISLGSFGGRVVFGFDHAVKNVSGEYDLQILGNYKSNDSEPGIVCVSHDDNHNGLPDDPWYELAGSHFGAPSTIHHYSITYYRPVSGHTPAPLNRYVIDTVYLAWRDNQGHSAHLHQNSFHLQNYYPEWIPEDSLTFSGTQLPNNSVYSGGIFNLYPFAWGYVDNAPNDSSLFNLDWAVDADGQSVHLDSIHFVMVYTAINQQCGWIGETSTEVAGAIDLHAAASTALTNRPAHGSVTLTSAGQPTLTADLPAPATLRITGPDGRLLRVLHLPAGHSATPVPLPPGLYLLHYHNHTTKALVY